MSVEECNPPGAMTAAELNQWPALFKASIKAKYSMMAESILSKLDGGVVIESDSSGMGCMEQAGAIIGQAVELQSPSPHRCFEVHRCVRQRPAITPCAAMSGSREKALQAVSPTSSILLLPWPLCRALPVDGLPAAKRGALASVRILSRERSGEAMVEDLCTILEKTAVLPNGFCCTHDRACDLYSGAVCDSSGR